jgi:uncharacterized protein involved in tolerance to divalent cations
LSPCARRWRLSIPYELPELVVLAISAGDGPYLAWLEESVRDHE